MSKIRKTVTNKLMGEYLITYWNNDSSVTKGAKAQGVNYNRFHYVVSRAIAKLKKANQPYQTSDTHVDTLVSNASSFFGLNSKRASSLRYSVPVFDSIKDAKRSIERFVPDDEKYIIDVFYNTIIFHERNTKENA